MEHLTPGFRQGELLLERLCLQQQVIPGISERVKFYPGSSLLTDPNKHQILINYTRPEGRGILILAQDSSHPQHEHPGFSLEINGRFGLVLTLGQDTEVPVAQCGFDFKQRELVVTNTPQGLTRDKLSCHPEEIIKAVLGELRTGNFRSELLDAVIRIGQAFRATGIERIRGIAAEHHDKVDINGGPLSLAVALKSMNELYERHGFTKDETGDYYLPI